MKRIMPVIMHITVVFIASLIFVDTLYPENGNCFVRNHHGQVEYIYCPCQCIRYGILDNGTCTRCGHRQARQYPNVIGEYERRKQIDRDITGRS